MKKRRINFVFILLIVIGSLLMTACSSTPIETTKADAGETDSPKTSVAADAIENGFKLANPDSKLVYVIAASRQNAYFDAIYKFAEKRAQELGYDTKSVSHDDDAQKESDLFDSAISDKAAAIICDNAGSDASIESVRKATNAGIPVFLLDREINENGIAITQITANNHQGASDVAMAFAEAMGEKGKYVELVGKESDTQSQIRSDAFNEILNQYENLELVSKQGANWDRNEAFAKVESIIQANPDIQGIICGNDDMALGALAAVKAANLNDVKVAGFDGIDEALDAIREDEMVATAMDMVSKSATMCVDQMDAFIKNGTTGQPEKQLVDCLLITSDNVDNVKDFAIIDE